MSRSLIALSINTRQAYMFILWSTKWAKQIYCKTSVSRNSKITETVTLERKYKSEQKMSTESLLSNVTQKVIIPIP